MKHLFKTVLISLVLPGLALGQPASLSTPGGDEARQPLAAPGTKSAAKPQYPSFQAGTASKTKTWIRQYALSAMGIGAAIAAGWYIFALRSENYELRSKNAKQEIANLDLKVKPSELPKEIDIFKAKSQELEQRQQKLDDQKKIQDSLDRLMINNRVLQTILQEQGEELTKGINFKILKDLTQVTQTPFHLSTQSILPDDLIITILSHLSPREIISLRSLNHRTKYALDRALIKYPAMFFKKLYAATIYFGCSAPSCYAVGPLDKSLKKSDVSAIEFFQDLSKFFCGTIERKKMAMPVTYVEPFFNFLNCLGGAHAIKEVLSRYPFKVWIGPEMSKPQTSEFYPAHSPEEMIRLYTQGLDLDMLKKAVHLMTQFPRVGLSWTRETQNNQELVSAAERYLRCTLSCLFENPEGRVTRCVSLSSILYNNLVGYGSEVFSPLKAACQDALALQTMHIRSAKMQHVQSPIPKVCQQIVLETEFVEVPEWGEVAFTNLEYMLGIRKFDKPNKQLQPDNHNVATLRLLNYPLVVEKLEDNPFIKGHNIANLIVHIPKVSEDYEGLTNGLKEALQQCVNNSATLKSIEIRAAYNEINWGDSAVLYQATKTLS
jgi:hypothetical protein